MTEAVLTSYEIRERDPAVRDRAGARWPGGWYSPQRLRQIFDLLPAAVVVLDGAGRVRAVNAPALDLFGEPILGRPWREIVAIAFAPAGTDTRGPRLRDGRHVHVAIRALAPDPGQVVLIQEREPAPTGLFASREETALILAHQMRTPLSTATLYAGLLGQATLSAGERLRIAARLRTALGHLGRLVDDILLSARADRLPKIPVKLEELIDELRALVDPWLAERSCRLTCPENLPAVILSAHRDGLLTALQNLVTNAAEACGSGGRLELAVRRAGAGMLEFILSDDGPGVPQHLRGQIFEPFFTLHPGGTGLGLAVVRAMARAHGGDAECEDAPGGGSRFTLRIRCGRSAAEEAVGMSGGAS